MFAERRGKTLKSDKVKVKSRFVWGAKGIALTMAERLLRGRIIVSFTQQK